MTDERDWIPPQAGIEGDLTLYESASGDYTERYWDRISRIRRHTEDHNYTQSFTWQREGDDSFFYCNYDLLIWEENEEVDERRSTAPRQSTAPTDEERDHIIAALNESPETLINLNKYYCKPLDIEEMTPVERCFWRQIDPETFQEVWDEIQDEWGTPDSGVTEIFSVESVIIQKLLTEKNYDNEDNETHIERVHRMVNYISNRNNARNTREPIEFQRIGDEEFMWDNMGTDLWMRVEDDKVMDRWTKRKEEKAKTERNECGEMEKLCEETSKTTCEKKQPRSAPRPGSCCCTRSGKGSGRPRDHTAATSMGAGAGRPSLDPAPGSAPSLDPAPGSAPTPRLSGM
jgi:hypothetical protein